MKRFEVDSVRAAVVTIDTHRGHLDPAVATMPVLPGTEGRTIQNNAVFLPASPWGGFKMSGIGRENGLIAYHEYTQCQSIIVSLSQESFDWYADNGQLKRYS